MTDIMYLPVSRVLTSTEIQLLAYCGSEREAVSLAKVISLPEHATYEQIEIAVIEALVRAKESVSGKAQIEYVNGQRRDTLRFN